MHLRQRRIVDVIVVMMNCYFQDTVHMGFVVPVAPVAPVAPVDMGKAWQIVVVVDYHRMGRIRSGCIRPFHYLGVIDRTLMDQFDPVMTVVLMVTVSVTFDLHQMDVLADVHHLGLKHFRNLSWSFDLNNNFREFGSKMDFVEHFGELLRVSRLGLEESRWAIWKLRLNLGHMDYLNLDWCWFLLGLLVAGHLER